MSRANLEAAMMIRCVTAVGVVSVLASVVAPAGEMELLPLGDPERAVWLASARAGTYYDCRQNGELGFDELATALAQARVVLVGEAHTHMEQKLFHARLLRALAERRPKLVLGMEFFLRSDREPLARWGRGELDDAELVREVGWYDRGGYRFEYYLPVMEAARDLGIPVVGLNVPREIPRAVNRGGLDGLDDEQRDQVGEVRTDGSPQHRYLIARYFGETVAMLPPGWFDNMYSAQCLWDVVMARSILDELEPEATMMVIVGSGHVAYDLGIPRRINEELTAGGLPPLTVATLVPVLAPPPDPGGDPHGHPMGGHGAGMAEDGGKPARFVTSLADYVAVFDDTGGVEAFPAVGLGLDEADDDSPMVSMIWPDTLAEAAGFSAGDRILDLNGKAPADRSELRRMLAGIEWGQRLGFLVESDGETREIAVLLYPEVESSETTTAPGFSVAAVGEFDPTGPGAVASVDDEESATRVLVSKDGRPLRVELRAGGRLDEVHELDSDGRVSRSLYREPLPEGTVEVRYSRAAGGTVVSTTHLDRAGAVLEN
jgi:uncharacterized iron-regulated protein